MIISGVTLRGTSAYDASFNPQGLVVYLDANNTASYPGTGTTLNDLSGNGYTHTLSNSNIYTMMNGIRCFNCSATGQVILANSTTIQIPTNFTYITWTRVRSSTAGFRTLLRSYLNGGHAVIINTGTNLLGMWDNLPGNTGFNSSGYNMAAYGDVWAQFATVGDASGQTFYINGQQVGSSVAKSVAGQYHYAWGNIQSANDQPWGYVANLELYNTKFTADQIRQNYYYYLPNFATPASVTSNLVLWYDPDNSVSYPGTGTTVNNLASTALAGTMSNIAYTDPYFSYNGTNSQVSVADNALLEPGSGDWTMEAWVYLSNTTGGKVVLGKFNNGGGSDAVSYSIRISGSSLFAQMGSGSPGAYVNSTSYTLPLNTWTQVTYVWKAGATKTLETFINGTSIGVVTHTLSSLLNASNPLYLGSYNGGEYSQWMAGRIGITRLYSAALTSGQVLQNYNANRATYGL
jgi:hypothetical protein